MFKRLLLFVITLCCLASMPGVGIPEELRLPPGKTSFPPEILARLGALLPEKPSLPADLAALTAGYPGFCLGVEVRPDRKVYLIMKNQQKLLYDDGLVKSFEDKLKRPDLKDMLAQVYRPGRDREPFRPDYDPGRFRVDAEMPGPVDHREQQVAELGLDLAGRPLPREGLVQFAEFLVDLAPRAGGIRPVEPGPRSAPPQLGRARQRGQRDRHVVEQAGRAAARLLGGLQAFPSCHAAS